MKGKKDKVEGANPVVEDERDQEAEQEAEQEANHAVAGRAQSQ